MSTKKVSKRSKSKYPGLDPKLNLKIRQELIDYDYVDKLSDKEKDWLNRFTEEYIGANMRHKGPKIHKKKRHIKDCYDRNNARNRDTLSLSNSHNKTRELDYRDDASDEDKEK